MRMCACICVYVEGNESTCCSDIRPTLSVDQATLGERLQSYVLSVSFTYYTYKGKSAAQLSQSFVLPDVARLICSEVCYFCLIIN